MKRLFIAAALLALTVGLCVGSRLTLNRGVDALLAALDETEGAYRAGDTAAAQATADRLSPLFDKEARFFPLFLPHEHLDAAEDSLAALPALLPGDRAAFEAELARCRLHLQRLRDGERLTPDNIL